LLIERQDNARSTITAKILELIPVDLVERCQTSWETNQKLSHSAWGMLNDDMHTIFDAGSLPSARSLLLEVTAGTTVEDFVRHDVSSLKAEVLRWFVLVKLSQCLSIVDPARVNSCWLQPAP
jgi:hypothetical protein